jgi:DNA-directed RNA polymerase specialized sigma24 family protein
MQAERFLKQIADIKIKIVNKELEKQMFKELATSITAQMGGERVQSSSTKEKMASNIIEAVSIQEQIDILTDTYKDIISVIERLDTAHYKIVHYVYVQGLSFKAIARKEGKCESWARKMNNRALSRVQDILDGRKRRC